MQVVKVSEDHGKQKATHFLGYLNSQQVIRYKKANQIKSRVCESVIIKRQKKFLWTQNYNHFYKR